MPPIDTKETYQRKTELRLKKIRTRITTLEKKADETEADIKVRHDQKLSQIRGHYAQSKENLNKLRKSGQEAWFELRIALDDAIEVLEESINDLSRRMSIRPED
jgi:chromosome segregation ATPase